jgi:hypothetical protein
MLLKGRLGRLIIVRAMREGWSRETLNPKSATRFKAIIAASVDEGLDAPKGGRGVEVFRFGQ